MRICSFKKKRKREKTPPTFEIQQMQHDVEPCADCFLHPAPAEFLTITARTRKTSRIYARTIIEMH